MLPQQFACVTIGFHRSMNPTCAHPRRAYISMSMYCVHVQTVAIYIVISYLYQRFIYIYIYIYIFVHIYIVECVNAMQHVGDFILSLPLPRNTQHTYVVTYLNRKFQKTTDMIMYIVYAYSFLCVQDIVVMPPFQFIDINVSFCRVDNIGCVYFSYSK